MAAESRPSAAGAHLSIPELLKNVRRNRELYKYLEPDDLLPPGSCRRGSVSSASANVSSITNALAPFAQLAALRCNAQRAMINVMDKNLMYFLAEATHDVSLAGREESMKEDLVFRGCAAVPLAGRICEMTIRMDAGVTDGTQYPIFQVADLSKDTRFNEMSIIREGTPLATPQGVNIGSLAVMATEVRDGLSEEQIRSLGELSSHIMTVLDINRQAIAGKRARRLAEGLDNFVVGRRSLADGAPVIPHEPDSRPHLNTNYSIAAPAQDSIHLRTTDQVHSQEPSLKRDDLTVPRTSVKESRESARGSVSSEDPMELAPDPRQPSGLEEDDLTTAKIFARAANLIRESLDLREDSGVLFLNVGSELDALDTNGEAANKEEALLHGMSTTARFPADRESVLLLASSTSELPLAESQYPDKLKDALKMPQQFLRDLIKHYPGGRIWAFGDNGVKLTSSSDDESRTRNARRGTKMAQGRSTLQSREIALLQKAFPDARSILFYPVFDIALSLYPAAGFVFSCSETRPLTNPTVTFMNSFCNTAKAECGRIEAIKSDRQKTDFVSTISHEMRSPLHGILASVEFLTETDLNGFQKSLVDTVDACGRTLLETINHILDFSKISSFEVNWHTTNRANRRTRRRRHAHGLTTTARLPVNAPQILQLTAATDISVILEEIVDGIAIGQTYSSGLDITDLSRENRGRAGHEGKLHDGIPVGDEPVEPPKALVETILDIEQADWVFFTSPGSLRRVFMNIFGNAIKYTQAGSVRVQLKFRDIDESSDRTKMMLLVVTDTGKGISPEFLSSKLFLPFAQENALSPGTGLGLSIVRSIVTMLGGNIDVQSRVNEGTTVRVALPLERPFLGTNSANTTPSSTTSASIGSIQKLRNLDLDCRVAIVGLENGQPAGSTFSLAAILAHYVRDWYGLELLQPLDYEKANVIILEDRDLDSVLGRSFGDSRQRPSLIVLCSISSHRRKLVLQEIEHHVDALIVVPKPCGPYKLARAFRSLRNRPKGPGSFRLQTIAEQITPFSPGPTSDGLAEELQELDLGAAGNNDTATMVQASENLAASQASQHAQGAIRSVSAEGRSTNAASHALSFPFPVQEPRSPAAQQPRDSIFSAPNRRRSSDRIQQTGNGPSPGTHREQPTSTPTPLPANSRESKPDNPRVLLVDDNQINLKLLQAFVRRRGYVHIGLAEDGEEAVDAVKSAYHAKTPYEIIFMDISMPKMNGFDATKAIRTYESQFGRDVDEGKGAMIIALTGLASARDQAEAFTVGCDLYLMKPVKFREVGRLLDNWEGHRRRIRDRDGEADVGVLNNLKVGGSLPRAL